MYMRTIGVALLVLSGLVAGLPAQSKTFPVTELKPGMVATGRTVFQGDQIEEFKAHILGVLHNSIGPRRDLILARLEGGPLANTGVIAGMSGSPVYIDGRLVGGLYGVALGHMFFGESMFSTERDASKVALKRLCEELISRGFHMIDCQMSTPHLMSLGAQMIPRADFTQALDEHLGGPFQPGPWNEAATPAGNEAPPANV